MPQYNLGGISSSDATAMVRRIAKLKNRKNFTWKQWAVVVLSALVLVSPIDFMPEAVLGPIGLGDDIGLSVWSMVLLGLRSHATKTLAKLETQGVDTSITAVDDVIDGELYEPQRGNRDIQTLDGTAVAGPDGGFGWRMK